MTTLLREKLVELKNKYIDVLDEINVIKADGDLAKLCNLRNQFDETFDAFFDNEEIAKKYGDWNDEEDRRSFDKSNGDIEEELDQQDLKELIKFYEGYIGDLEDEYIDLGGDMEELRKIYEEGV